MTGSRVELVPGLNELVAARFARPAVEHAAGAVESAARLRAPAAKLWVTAHDERVRPSHADADGQIIPANLRYKLRKQTYVHGSGRGSGSKPVHWPGHTVLAPGFDLARVPRDETLPADQAVNCRCESAEIPDAVARTIHALPATLAGVTVRAEVETRFPRAAESEFGTSGDAGAHFMSGAVREVAARMR